MKAGNESLANRRIDYHWPADHSGGIETTSMIYDRDGRLVAVDYVMAPPARTDGPPEVNGSSVAPPRTTR